MQIGRKTILGGAELIAHVLRFSLGQPWSQREGESHSLSEGDLKGSATRSSAASMQPDAKPPQKSPVGLASAEDRVGGRMNAQTEFFFSKVHYRLVLGLESHHTLVGLFTSPASQCAARLCEISSALSQTADARHRCLLRLMLLDFYSYFFSRSKTFALSVMKFVQRLVELLTFQVPIQRLLAPFLRRKMWFAKK